MDINNENLENTLNSNETPQPEAAPTVPVAPQMPKEMEIGFHQGALNTLAGEKHALIEMITQVESRMQSHAQRLQELGVNIQQKTE